MTQPADEPAPFASRAGEKLAAALRTFALEHAVRGAAALDVGASHGGFTDVLLRLGAARVTAIDVGHDQMREPLRSDSRVELMERTNFKTLSLKVAPGPFGFFVMDVSFASARSMLRAIAMRVAPGTPGIVLVKPQFELPKVLVPGGGVVESKGLRKLAFNRFKKRARERGFEVVARMDSPVSGGSGNVEILAHLVLRGVPQTEAATTTPPAPVPNLSAPGAKLPAKPAPKRKRPPKPKRPPRTGGKGPAKV